MAWEAPCCKSCYHVDEILNAAQALWDNIPSSVGLKKKTTAIATRIRLRGHACNTFSIKYLKIFFAFQSRVNFKSESYLGRINTEVCTRISVECLFVFQQHFIQWMGSALHSSVLIEYIPAFLLLSNEITERTENEIKMTRPTFYNSFELFLTS